MSAANRRPLALKIQPLEALETRRTPAHVHLPWLDPEHLTISFAPDGAKVGSQPSTLFQTMDQSGGRDEWRREILRAFQSWAIHANINIGLQPDYGLPFGSPGKAQGEKVFGDIRIGAVPLSSNVVMSSAPYDPVFAGTLSGDVVVNSLYKYSLVPGEPRAGVADLFAGMLHEAGHVFGMEHTDDADSVMKSHISSVRQLSRSDIENLQYLYGRRHGDEYEGDDGNDEADDAASLTTPSSSRPTVAYGDITTTSDVDFYEVRSPRDYRGAMVFKVRTVGRSLLAPSLKVFDSNGVLLGESSSVKLGGDEVTVKLNSVMPKKTFYVAVEGAVKDEFGVGGYAMGAALDNIFGTGGMTLSMLLANPNIEAPPVEANSFFYQFTAGDKTPNELAVTSQTQTNALRNRVALDGEVTEFGARYQTRGALASATDMDVYEVVSPRFDDREFQALLVRVSGFGLNAAPPKAVVLDQKGLPVESEVLVSSMGGYMIQVCGIKPNSKYFIRIEMPEHPLGPVRYYQMEALFTGYECESRGFLDGTAEPQSTRVRTLYLAESQIFHLLLETGGLAGLQMTIRDSNGKVVFRLTSNGDPISAVTPYLDEGTYTIEFTSTNASETIAYQVCGMALTEPVGPGLINPIRSPVTDDSGGSNLYQYPNGIISDLSYYWL